MVGQRCFKSKTPWPCSFTSSPDTSFHCKPVGIVVYVAGLSSVTWVLDRFFYKVVFPAQNKLTAQQLLDAFYQSWALPS